MPQSFPNIFIASINLVDIHFLLFFRVLTKLILMAFDCDFDVPLEREKFEVVYSTILLNRAHCFISLSKIISEYETEAQKCKVTSNNTH